jgi:ATP-dependent Zn protease
LSAWFLLALSVSQSSRTQFRASCFLRVGRGSSVFLVILSVFFENTGFMKAGPRQSQFEPTEGKTVKFSDVHGVDEAKDVRVSDQESIE